MRNPDYNFFSASDMDVTQIIRTLTETYQSMYQDLTSSAFTVRPASVENLFIRWIADIILHERELTNYAANQNLPSRAAGENLDALAELFFAQKRTPALPASCTVRFSISTPRTTATLIPAGTRVTDSAQTLYWETLSDAYIPAGMLYIDLAVRCQTAGTAGNGWPTGTIHTIVDVYDYYSGCTNITVSGGGADEQSDDELYDSMINSMAAPSTAGSKSGYAYYAKSVSTQIADVAVRSPAPGEIRIYTLMKNGAVAGETVKQAIYNACNADDVRPLADHVETADPDVIYYKIRLAYWIPDGVPDAAAVESAVRDAVEKYAEWQGAKLGRDINPSVLTGYVMQSGVKRVQIDSPVYTPLGSGNDSTPPAAALIANPQTDIVLINGGIEDD